MFYLKTLWHIFLPLVLVLPGLLSSSAQQISLDKQSWSAEVIRPRGQPVIPLFDGWFVNSDGTRSLCFSYFNPNTEQSLSIPLGEANYLSDSRFAAVLPSHFDPLPPRYRHKFCVFTVTVPADFSRDETLVWHLSSAGQSLSVPGHILPAYVLDEPASHGRGDVAPLVKLSANDAGVRGRKGVTNPTLLRGRVKEPLTLQAWIEHPDAQVWVGWAKHSGPGDVQFSKQEYMMNTGAEATTVTATFSAPGSYLLRMQTIDDIDAFEFYCCHSNAYFPIEIGN